MLKLLLSLALLAGAPVAAIAKPRPAPQIGDSGRYVCADGRSIEVLYGGGVAVLTIAGTALEMQRSPGQDTEHYAGGGWQWSAQGKRIGALSGPSTAANAPPNPVTCHEG